MNLVEVFFGIITRQAIRRGSVDTVKQLIAAIRAFIDAYNDRCRPLAWTKPSTRSCPRHPSTNFRRGTLGRVLKERRRS